jgi:hypothetical protein
MSRKYTVTQRNAEGKVITATHFEEPVEALGNFQSSLRTANHSDRTVEQHLRALTVALMKGGTGLEVLDPGLNGSISITITTTT